MIFFGHLGIGLQISKPFIGRRSEPLPIRWILLGTLLPDLLDKPLYQISRWTLGLEGSDLGLISGGRTFGHTLVFVLLLFTIGTFSKRKSWLALALGACTHLFLDHFTDYLQLRFWEHASKEDLRTSFAWTSERMKGLFFPFIGLEFMTLHQTTFSAYSKLLLRPIPIGAEILGLMFLGHSLLRKNRLSQKRERKKLLILKRRKKTTS